MGTKVRVGVIGAGGIARGAHLPGYAKIPDEATVVAISDIDEPRAQRSRTNLAYRKSTLTTTRWSRRKTWTW